MTRARARLAVLAAALLSAAWYLHDPPWIGAVTSGMRDWEQDAAGTRLRWTAGRASFYVPSAASEMTLPMRALFPSGDGRPVVVGMSVDGRWLTDVTLNDPAGWVNPTVPLPRRTTWRSYRRVDLRVSRTVGALNLGVQVGEPRLR